ncbi:MAG: transposase, partial [Terrimicrobiaceae bacterium]
MATSDLRSTIPEALSQFQTGPLKDAARRLLAELGYKSDKFLAGAGSKPQDFLDDFVSGHAFDQTKALVSEWKSADLLFQLTDQELSRETSLFTDTSVQAGLLKSYVFIAIELKDGDYARGKFSAIARQINRLFPMPVMVIFKHADRLTIAVINRRRNKIEPDKGVLEKATLIRDISITNPHRGHLDILASLAMPNLVHPKKLPIADFDTLHAAWEQIFNVELLNERFYRELANWYFWALPQVEFPADLEPDDEKRRATGLIRLLTRLIFCWFLKEKGLIPEQLFHPSDLAKILNDFDPESETNSTYYQAILQNLFFATLNQRMGKDAKGQPYRVFAKDEGFQKNRATYDINNLYRYEALFQESPETALAHFADIPFLNGGLFECLDRTEDGTDKKRYLDGFSRNAKKRPHVPDRLFFDSGEIADLSTAYGDTKRKAEKVTGLITILNRYKFTIVENTPIDQEIALDPELLGKVFENLLASYNEETKTTARKQTGSFYTPRPIVDYMVDESLKAHLERVVQASSLNPSNENKQDACATLPFLNPHAEIETTERNLPHWKQRGVMYFVTFRLADSLPKAKLDQLQQERATWLAHHAEPYSDSESAEYQRLFSDRVQDWLDAGAGSCCLADASLAEIVGNALRHFDGKRYLLDEWVVMPNHVHVLLTPMGEHTLETILHSWKSFTATAINKAQKQTGQLWQHESYDHIVRSEAQLAHFREYIQQNPAKANVRVAQASSLNPPKPSKQDACTTLAPLRSRLDLLFSYTEQPHQFSEPEVAALISAIDALKILDPACGSGAFPMGVLHKLVYILGKLDPDNDRWKATQLAKLDSAPMREELERAFADNNDDYGRKLYLIENCLYGVDIQ